MKQNLLELLYTTWIHNDFAIACLAGIFFAIFLLLKRPSRFGVLLLIGFSVLLLRFQYLKHIVEPLLDQTTGVLLRDETTGGSRFLFVVFNVLIPFGMYVLGWGSIFLALALSEFRKHKLGLFAEQQKHS